MHTFTMTEKQARLIHDMARERIAAHHNWIASAVESGDLTRAQLLTRALREHQAIFAGFNMTAILERGERAGMAPDTDHVVRLAR